MNDKNQGVNKQAFEVPKKPESMEEFWPTDGKKEVNKKDGVWLQYRDILIGPFPNRTEAGWYDGQLQEIISGWIDKSRFAGRIFPINPVDNQWYVERWETNDGPFSSMAVAWDHRQALYIEYREVIARHWDNSGGYPADIERQKKWSKVPTEVMEELAESDLRVRLLNETKLEIPAYIQTEVRKTLAEATDDPMSNYQGYVVSYNGAVHIDPATGEAHRDDHICNQQCRDLSRRARADFWADLDRKSGGKPKKATDDIMDVSGEDSIWQFLKEHKDIVAPGGWMGPTGDVMAAWDRNKKALEDISLEDDDEDVVIPDDKLLTHGDIPVIMGILMDRLGITRFEFSVEEMMAFKGRVILDQPDSRKSSYLMVRQGE